eukprot:33159-Prorocentrum_minimum.AAC.1
MPIWYLVHSPAAGNSPRTRPPLWRGERGSGRGASFGPSGHSRAEREASSGSRRRSPLGGPGGAHTCGGAQVDSSRLHRQF